MTEVARYLLLLVPPLWLGMVLAISFLEAPLKFRAPGVTLPVGLGIGRLVFKALNTVEVVLLLLLLSSAVAAPPGPGATVLLGVAAAVLFVQIVFVRPPLTKRSNRVLAGEVLPRSRAHLAYVGLETVKVIVLTALAISLAGGVI